MGKRRKQGNGAGANPTCRMCGMVMPLGPDGRCALGHFVGGVATAPVEPVAAPAALAPVLTPAATPVPAEQHHHPYDDVLTWAEAVSEVTPAALPSRPLFLPAPPGPQPPEAPGKSLLDWDEIPSVASALDVDSAELPAITPAAPVASAAPAQHLPLESEAAEAEAEAEHTQQVRRSILLGSGVTLMSTLLAALTLV